MWRLDWLVLCLMTPLNFSAMGQDRQDLQFFKDVCKANSDLIGNADISLTSRVEIFESKIFKKSVRTVDVESQLALDGSILAVLSGDVVPLSATEILLSDYGILRYFPHRKVAYIQPVGTPGVVIDPFRCLRISSGMTVQEAMESTTSKVISIHNGPKKSEVTLAVPSQKTPEMINHWQIGFSEESGYLPTSFAVRNDGEVLLIGSVQYFQPGPKRAYFPKTWSIKAFSGEQELFEEIGEVHQVHLLPKSSRKSVSFDWSKCLRLVDGVAQTEVLFQGL